MARDIDRVAITNTDDLKDVVRVVPVWWSKVSKLIKKVKKVPINRTRLMFEYLKLSVGLWRFHSSQKLQVDVHGIIRILRRPVEWINSSVGNGITRELLVDVDVCGLAMSFVKDESASMEAAEFRFDVNRGGKVEISRSIQLSKNYPHHGCNSSIFLMATEPESQPWSFTGKP